MEGMNGLLQLPFIELYGIFKSKVNSIADQCVPDTYFIQAGDMLFEITEMASSKSVGEYVAPQISQLSPY